MKKLFFLTLSLIVVLNLSAQVEVKPNDKITKVQDAKPVNVDSSVPVTEAPATPPTKAVMTFEDGGYDTKCDYGSIEYNGEPLRVVKFKNTGTEPLIIKNARGSCGCTVPNWPKEPILPGESGQIEIRYATNRVGPINKKVTVTTNEEKEHIISVLGTVGPEPKKEVEESVPAGTPNVIKGGL
jgi:hypothetical protein